jgi:hypothetical protein
VVQIEAMVQSDLPSRAPSVWNGVEYAMPVKLYGTPIETSQNPTARRYSPPEVVAIERQWIMGKPDVEAISTSFVERQKLTMDMNIRRLTRLTNGIPRRWRITFRRWRCISSNNFCRPHRTLTKAHPAITQSAPRWPLACPITSES